MRGLKGSDVAVFTLIGLAVGWRVGGHIWHEEPNPAVGPVDLLAIALAIARGSYVKNGGGKGDEP